MEQEQEYQVVQTTEPEQKPKRGRPRKYHTEEEIKKVQYQAYKKYLENDENREKVREYRRRKYREKVGPKKNWYSDKTLYGQLKTTIKELEDKVNSLEQKV